MLQQKETEHRKAAECAAFSSEELGLRELIALEEEFQWEEIMRQLEVELYELEIGLHQQYELKHFRFHVMSLGGLNKLLEKETDLDSSIQSLQARLDRANKWLKTSEYDPEEAVREKMRSWNDEKEALELQMAQLRIRIARLNEGPSAVAPPELKKNRATRASLVQSHSESSASDVQVSRLSERTRETLARARNILL
ncbi:hypothetical protein DQ04_03041020 [Trypanosoma grayi]|uniref:hypothetical protein n=1 Tax=Trypanosoma grayi TaxID=71804 RepID=UPI0004F40D46|nr:hypothetical protein DQ04_03041020 [Trypanosoma grayi]KEG11031.1 hypothetical protein DQ04_03041020 [Trypanosoma grayi]